MLPVQLVLLAAVLLLFHSLSHGAFHFLLVYTQYFTAQCSVFKKSEAIVAEVHVCAYGILAIFVLFHAFNNCCFLFNCGSILHELYTSNDNALTRANKICELDIFVSSTNHCIK